MSKGFVGKGPRSRPSSVRPYSSIAGEQQQQQQQQQQLPVGLEAVPEVSNGDHNNASGGSGAVVSAGSGGGRGTTDVSGRASGGRLNGGSDGTGHQLRSRSRSTSLSRENPEHVEQADKQGNSGRAEPEAQQASHTAEGQQADSIIYIHAMYRLLVSRRHGTGFYDCVVL